MQFRDLKSQYEKLKQDINTEIQQIFTDGNFISGRQVEDLEENLSLYIGAKHCVTCANGTDALTLALMVWNIGSGDAVFVPDFTFFATGEAVAFSGATPIFVDVEEDTFNISPKSLTKAIEIILKEGKLAPKAIVAVDLFGQPANYSRIKEIALKYQLFLLEDGAQGFGGSIGNQRACSFGDISTTSFFPAKPLGCYGDGGAVFTDNDEWADLLRSYRIHGKGTDKYDNVRIGMNSRLDTLQAAILNVKLKAFQEYELLEVNKVASRYSEKLRGIVKVPTIKDGYHSSWAQYSILLENEELRNGLQSYLKERDIPSMIYYSKPMSQQIAFLGLDCKKVELPITTDLCHKVLSLPIHPYMNDEDQNEVIHQILSFLNQFNYLS